MKELVLKEKSIDDFLNECCIKDKNQQQGTMMLSSSEKHYAIKEKIDLTSIEKVVFKRNEHTTKTGTEVTTNKIYLVKEYDDYCWQLVLEE